MNANNASLSFPTLLAKTVGGSIYIAAVIAACWVGSGVVISASRFFPADTEWKNQATALLIRQQALLEDMSSRLASLEARQENSLVIPLGSGPVSWFGGPDDDAMPASDKTAITNEFTRQLDPEDLYCAMRWNEHDLPYSLLRRSRILFTANGRHVFARPVDHGPVRRFADVSPAVLEALDLETDDIITAHLEVIP